MWETHRLMVMLPIRVWMTQVCHLPELIKRMACLKCVHFTACKFYLY